MNPAQSNVPLVAIACGGTGGHLFPGLAVALQLRQAGCDVALLISPKDVDQQAVKSVSGMAVHTQFYQVPLCGPESFPAAPPGGCTGNGWFYKRTAGVSGQRAGD